MSEPVYPIHPDLFDQVDDYIAASSAAAGGSVSVEQAQAIVIFYQSFFQQFFQVLGQEIVGFSPGSETEAIALRRSLSRPGDLPTRRVIARFETICQIDAELAAGQYLYSSDTFLQFHTQNLGNIMRDISVWAASAGLPEIQGRAKQALESYSRARPDLVAQQASGLKVQPDSLKELVRLVELDYDRTAKFIDGVLGTSATIRSLLITAWVAVLTLAFDTSRWALGAMSFAIIVVFGVLDAYHSALYQRALTHAVERESASQGYYETLIFGDDFPDARANLMSDLELQEFGVYRNIHKVSTADLRSARPQILFSVLYPALLAVSVIATIILAVK
jgi:hypothetical protein